MTLAWEVVFHKNPYGPYNFKKTKQCLLVKHVCYQLSLETKAGGIWILITNDF